MVIDMPGGGENGKTVIVTGAGGGLGRAMSHRLLRDGYTCVLADLKESAIERTLELAGEYATRAVPVTGDICLPEDRDRLVEYAAEQSGTLYGLVNNAGIAEMRPLLDESPDEWRLIFETNLEAAYFLAQKSIERMRRNRSGRIINIASMNGMVALNNDGLGERAPEVTEGDRGPVRQSAYGASKGGLIHLTRELAAAVGRWGITVNSVSPGNVPHGSHADDDGREDRGEKEQQSDGKWRRPRLGDRVDPEIERAVSRQTPLQRLGKVEEIAGPVSFLLSADASYITGANLVVDGGFTIW